MSSSALSPSLSSSSSSRESPPPPPLPPKTNKQPDSNQLLTECSLVRTIKDRLKQSRRLTSYGRHKILMMPSSGDVLDDSLCRELLDHPDTMRIVLRGVTLGSRLGCLQECLRALCDDDWAAGQLVSAVQVIHHSNHSRYNHHQIIQILDDFRQSTAFVKTSTARLKLITVVFVSVSPYLAVMEP